MSAEGSGEAVRLEVKSADGARLAEAKAPAPSGDVVHVELAAGPLGSAGALLEVVASTDTSECVSVWRYRDGRFARLPVHDAGGKDLPDCFPFGRWTHRFEQEGVDRPAVFVLEGSEKSPQGTLRSRDVYAFAGFSLNADPARSTREIEGVPIPSWYDSVLYSMPALETLYARYDLSRMRSEPNLRIEADRDRGVFALRLAAPSGEVVVPVDSYSERGRVVSLGGRLGEKVVGVTVGLGGAERNLPMEVEVAGLGEPFDQSYGLAGSWHGKGERVYASAADELAAQELASTWLDPQGASTIFALDGPPPYRLRVDGEPYRLDLLGAERPVDVLLRPAESAGRPWGIVLRGQNVIERIPFACPPEAPGRSGSACRADGPAQRLRRLGARANAR